MTALLSLQVLIKFRQFALSPVRTREI